MPNPEQPSWRLRRIAIFGLLIVCAAVIVYVVGWGDDNDLHRTAMTWAFGSAVVVVCGYAGFATLEDMSLAKLVR